MISKRYRANMESGIIHDMNNPCWSALHSNPKKMRDFFHLEEAKAEIEALKKKANECERCLLKKHNADYSHGGTDFLL